MRIFLLILTLLALAAGPAAAQAALTVVVTDSAGAGVPGVRVVVNGIDAAAQTDASGTAHVGGIALGYRLVTIDHPRYRHEEALLQFPSANDFRLEVTLTPAAVALDTLAVTTRRFNVALHQAGFYKRQQAGLGQFLTRESLDELNRRTASLASAFDRFNGIRADRETLGGFVLRSTRGSGSLTDAVCSPTLRIDGVLADAQQLSALTPAEVEAIEVYASAATVPGEFADGGSPCGLVLVWTRRS